MNHNNTTKLSRWASTFQFWIYIVVIAWSPSIFLSYTWVDASGEKWTVEGGKYIFFFIYLVAGFFLIPYAQPLKNFKLLTTKTKPIWYKVLWFLLAVSITISVMNYDSLRLFTIMIVLSACSIVSAMAIFNTSGKKQVLAFALFIMPIGVSVFGALCVQMLISFFPEISQALNIGAKTLGEGRYLFLNNEANGFGFDAAVTSLFALLMIDKNDVKLWHILKILFVVLGLYMLMKSNSRGAMVLFASSIFLYLVTLVSVRNHLDKLIVLLAVSVIGIVYFLDDWLVISFRLSPDMSELSSGRLDVWRMAVALIAEQTYGYGFGSSGEIIKRHLGNVYLGLGFEIGVMGVTALAFILWAHFKFCFKIILKLQGEKQFLFSFILTHGLLVWSNFEFEIFRISTAHQFFTFMYVFMILKALQFRDMGEAYATRD